jgi:ligand-binding SRPBCC domain-containing protein
MCCRMGIAVPLNDRHDVIWPMACKACGIRYISWAGNGQRLPTTAVAIAADCLNSPLHRLTIVITCIFVFPDLFPSCGGNYNGSGLKVNSSLVQRWHGYQILGNHSMKRSTSAVLILWLMMVMGLTACSSAQTHFYKRYNGFPGEINQHTRIIHAPVEKIFNILTDPEAFTALAPDFTHVSFETPPPYRKGTRLKIKIDHLLKFTWHTQVKEVIPYKMTRLEFLDGLFQGGSEIWEFETEDQGTRVIQTIIVDPPGLIGSLVWNLKARQRHNAMAEKFLDNLQMEAETTEKSLSAEVKQ